MSFNTSVLFTLRTLYHEYAIPRAHTQAVFSKVSNLKCGFRLLM